MYPGTYAATAPDRPPSSWAAPARSSPTASSTTRSIRLARILPRRGLQRGDHVAFFMENHPRFLEVAWAALRSGLYFTAVNSYLTVPEVAYIVNDCEAKAFITSAVQGRGRRRAHRRNDIPDVAVRLMLDGTIAGLRELRGRGRRHLRRAARRRDAWARRCSTRRARPAGRRASSARCPRHTPSDPDPAVLGWPGRCTAATSDTVYLSPAPLYHAAPLALLASTMQRLGGTVVVMEHFDPSEALALIERYRVTHSQLVPTMFVRMLKLPEDVRARYDVSSHRVAIHAAAPCPVEVKRADDRVVGPDHPRVLRRHRGQRRHVHRQRGVARAPGLGRARR